MLFSGNIPTGDSISRGKFLTQDLAVFTTDAHSQLSTDASSS